MNTFPGNLLFNSLSLSGLQHVHDLCRQQYHTAVTFASPTDLFGDTVTRSTDSEVRNLAVSFTLKAPRLLVATLTRPHSVQCGIYALGKPSRAGSVPRLKLTFPPLKQPVPVFVRLTMALSQLPLKDTDKNRRVLFLSTQFLSSTQSME